MPSTAAPSSGRSHGHGPGDALERAICNHAELQGFPELGREPGEPERPGEQAEAAVEAIGDPAW
jgi:hypothetical protein